MTSLSHIQLLTAAERRERMAKLAGWIVVTCPFVPAHVFSNALQRVFTREAAAEWKKCYPNGISPKLIPDYDSDLNAVREVELGLTEEQHRRFRAILWDLTEDYRAYASASAHDRVTAILAATESEMK